MALTPRAARQYLEEAIEVVDTAMKNEGSFPDLPEVRAAQKVVRGKLIRMVFKKLTEPNPKQS